MQSVSVGNAFATMVSVKKVIYGKKMVENLKGEIWKRYKNTDYWASTYGRIKRVYSRNERLLKPYRKTPKKGSWYLLAKVYGKAVKVSVMVWESFNGPVPAGYAVVHRNHHQGDNELVNLQLLPFKKLGSYYGGRTKKRKLVYDIDNNVFYKGTREAAKALHISRQTVSDYCNGKVKKPVVNIRWAKTFE